MSRNITFFIPKNASPVGKMREKSVTPPDRAGLSFCTLKFQERSKASGAPFSTMSTSQLMFILSLCLKFLNSGLSCPATLLLMSRSLQMLRSASFAICLTPVSVEAK